METSKIQKLLKNYFNGESTEEEERTLEKYFQSDGVAEELQEYAEFFKGITELSSSVDDSNIEEEVMDFILENEHQEKTKYRWLWQTVTGIAASVIIVLGGFLFLQQQQKPFEDSFEDPNEAYAYAEQTLQKVSMKYSKGLAKLSKFEKLNTGSEPLKKGITPINDFYNSIERIEKNPDLPENEFSDEKRKSNDSI